MASALIIGLLVLMTQTRTAVAAYLIGSVLSIFSTPIPRKKLAYFCAAF